ncbi:MAG TPA: hypothetical protein VNO30_00980 [Kofleriaceae bacterium]|nr:hypothetical protein [Kofleriaceae bacterium]
MTRPPPIPAAAAAAALGLAAGLALAACAGKPPPPPPPPSNGSDQPAGGVQDTRTELERRRDTACDKLGPKLAQCAVADSRAMLAAGKITRQQHEDATKPEVVRGLAADWRKKCHQGYMSSRQVRVLEVCFREESECGPLEACLRNLEPGAK